jgi:hypothetical protein
MSQSTISSFQRNLSDSAEAKNRFLNSEINSSTSEDDEVEEKKIAKPLPKKRLSSRIDMMLMEQYIQQQKDYLKAQKTIYKLKNEIDTEEVRSRYLKLDLNNEQVKNIELQQKVKYLNNKFSQSLSANVFLFMIILSYIMKLLFKYI